MVWVDPSQSQGAFAISCRYSTLKKPIYNLWIIFKVPNKVQQFYKGFKGAFHLHFESRRCSAVVWKIRRVVACDECHSYAIDDASARAVAAR
jgi:hypothetical protein